MRETSSACEHAATLNDLMALGVKPAQRVERAGEQIEVTEDRRSVLVAAGPVPELVHVTEAADPV